MQFGPAVSFFFLLNLFLKKKKRITNRNSKELEPAVVMDPALLQYGSVYV